MSAHLPRPTSMIDSARNSEFVRLLTASSGPVFGFILSLAPRWADAEEIFQEVCRSAWERFDTFQPGTDFTAWMCRDAHFKILDARKRWRKEPQLLGDLFDDEVVQWSIETDSLGDRHAALLDCLQKLNARDRELVARRYRDEQKPADIAKEEGLSVSSIHKALNRIQHALFNCIELTLRREAR